MKFSWFDSKTFHPTPQTDMVGYRIILLSHIATIIPIAIAANRPFPILYTILLLIQLVASITYHALPFSVLLRMLDWVTAWILIVTNVFVLFSYNTVLIKEKLIITIPLIIISLYFFIQFKKYPRNHAIWHVLSALITVIVVW